jgi:hypothetical protein
MRIYVTSEFEFERKLNRCVGEESLGSRINTQVSPDGLWIEQTRKRGSREREREDGKWKLRSVTCGSQQG